MTKRAILQLSGPSPKFRISRKGVDVDAAGPSDFLVHESHLIAQPFYSDFVPCPFAGYVGDEPQDATESVTIPNVTSDPIALIYTRHAGGQNVYPQRFSEGLVGSMTSEEAFDIYLNVISSTQINLRFVKQPYSRTSPQGCWLTVYRRAQ